MCCSLWFHVLGIFQQSSNSTYEAGIKWCAALCDYTCLVYFFQQSYPIPTYEAGIEWCAAFDYVLRVFFNSPTIPTYKAGIKWCAALFCDYMC
jgi:hypothetical protein